MHTWQLVKSIFDLAILFARFKQLLSCWDLDSSKFKNSLNRIVLTYIGSGRLRSNGIDSDRLGLNWDKSAWKNLFARSLFENDFQACSIKDCFQKVNISTFWQRNIGKFPTKNNLEKAQIKEIFLLIVI